jgi:hypothetical protein
MKGATEKDQHIIDSYLSFNGTDLLCDFVNLKVYANGEYVADYIDLI